jgi:quinol monooxygenase YgiN
MVLASLLFKVRREKRTEFVRAAENFVVTLRQLPGCLDCRFLADCELRGRYTVLSRWEGSAPLRQFLESNDFRALLGTRILLHDPPHIWLDEVVRCTRVQGRAPSKVTW